MLNYTFKVIHGTVVAYNPRTATEVWRRCLRTYFRNTQNYPRITLQASEDKVMAFWPGSTVFIDLKTGKVDKHIRSIFSGAA